MRDRFLLFDRLEFLRHPYVMFREKFKSRLDGNKKKVDFNSLQCRYPGPRIIHDYNKCLDLLFWDSVYYIY